MTVLPSTVGLKAKPCTSTAFLTSTACTNISFAKQKAVWHSSFGSWAFPSGEEKGLSSIVSKRGFFSPSEFSFLLLKQNNTKNQLYAQPKLANVNNFSVLIGRGQTGRLHTYTHTGKAESFNLILPSRACNKCSQDLFLFPFVFIKLWRVSFPFSFLSGALPILYYGSYKTWSTLFSLFFFSSPPCLSNCSTWMTM